MVTAGIVDALRCGGVGCTIPGHAPVVEKEDVAFTGQTFGDHVRMVLPNDPTQRMVLIIRSEHPDDVACFFVGDGGDAGLPAAPNDVVGVKALVAIGIPFVGSERRHRIHVHPIPDIASHHVGVSMHGISRFFAEAKIVEVFAAYPFPDDVPLPIDFDDGVIDKGLFGNCGVGDVFVTKDKGVDLGKPGHQAGGVITNGIARALVVVVLPGHPPRLFLVGVFDAFIFVKAPNDIAVPIDLDEVEFVLVPIFGVAQARAPHNESAGQYLGRETCHALPFVNDVAIHVNEIRMARHAAGEKGIPIITLVWIIKGRAGGVNRWVTHRTSKENGV